MLSPRLSLSVNYGHGQLCFAMLVVIKKGLNALDPLQSILSFLSVLVQVYRKIIDPLRYVLAQARRIQTLCASAIKLFVNDVNNLTNLSLENGVVANNVTSSHTNVGSFKNLNLEVLSRIAG